jgi:hypothetical protein
MEENKQMKTGKAYLTGSNHRHGKHLDGRPITDEEMERYQIELKNHEAIIAYKRELMERVLKKAEIDGIEYARQYFNREFDAALSILNQIQ